MIYLFDWDNTLFDPSIYSVIKPKLLGYGKCEGDSGNYFSSIDKLDIYYKVLKKEALSKNYMFIGAKEKLKELKDKGFIIGIVTNSYKKTIELYLEIYNIKVDFVYGCDDANATKEDDIYWQNLIEKHDLNPKDCLMMGDDYELDYLMPKKFGFNVKLYRKKT